MRLPLIAAAGLAIVGAGLVATGPGFAAERVVNAPAPALDPQARGTRETAVFAGGCFWGVQGVFSHVKGVESAVSGYTGGSGPAGGYESVSSGTTGHAEAVRVVYDPRQVSYGALLRIYFSVVADPTRLNAQGPDHGTQYRSALFPQTPQQAAVAKAYLAQLAAARLWARPIVTTIEPARTFYPAEAYHQDFLARHPDYPYIVVNDAPKVAALKRLFPLSYKG